MLFALSLLNLGNLLAQVLCILVNTEFELSDYGECQKGTVRERRKRKEVATVALT
jgi:hypothetical protein